MGSLHSTWAILTMYWRNLGWMAACCLSLEATGLLRVFKASVPSFKSGSTIIMGSDLKHKAWTKSCMKYLTLGPYKVIKLELKKGQTEYNSRSWQIWPVRRRSFLMKTTEEAKRGTKTSKVIQITFWEFKIFDGDLDKEGFREIDKNLEGSVRDCSAWVHLFRWLKNRTPKAHSWRGLGSDIWLLEIVEQFRVC